MINVLIFWPGGTGNITLTGDNGTPSVGDVINFNFQTAECPSGNYEVVNRRWMVHSPGNIELYLTVHHHDIETLRNEELAIAEQEG